MAETPDTDEASTASPESGTFESNELIEGIATHALFRLDESGSIASWPSPAKELYGYDAETVLHEDLSILFADNEENGNTSSFDEILTEAQTETIEEERWHERSDGSVFWGSLTISPLRSDQITGYAVVCQDHTQKKEYQRMLERQNDRLKEFTDILAHDLRNPLNVIDGRLTLFYETGEEEHIEVVEETSDRMARLVDDLLKVARQGVVVEDPTSTDIEAVITTAWEATGARTEASLEYDEVRRVSADADRLLELFENLFRNAIEHGDTPPTIRVGPLEDGFYVEDDGPGVPEALRDEVFDHGFTTTDDGSGYGLSIVRTIANAHGWDIRVVAGDTGGARFEITGIEFVSNLV